MSLAQAREPLRLPASLQTQLHAFRRRVWTIKMAEAAGAAVFVVLVAFLCVFALGSPLGYARLAAIRRMGGSPLRVRDRAVAPASLDLATAPLGAARPIAHREAPAARRPVAGHHRTGSQRGRAGAVAGPL